MKTPHGFWLAFLAALGLILAPATSAEAGRAEGGSMSGPAPSQAALTERLAAAGLPVAEAQDLVSGLSTEERSLLGERLDGADVGGWHVAVAIALIVGAVIVVIVVFDFLGHIHIFHDCHEYGCYGHGHVYP